MRNKTKITERFIQLKLRHLNMCQQLINTVRIVYHLINTFVFVSIVIWFFDLFVFVAFEQNREKRRLMFQIAVVVAMAMQMQCHQIVSNRVKDHYYHRPVVAWTIIYQLQSLRGQIHWEATTKYPDALFAIAVIIVSFPCHYFFFSNLNSFFQIFTEIRK